MSQDGGKGSGSGGSSLLECEEDDEESSSLENQPGDAEVELFHFRQKWQKELEVPASESNRQSSLNAVENVNKKNETDSLLKKPLVDLDEEKAKNLFLKGAEFERNGDLYEAIKFYKRAVQLVPDVEFRIYESSKLKSIVSDETSSGLTKLEPQDKNCKEPDEVVEFTNLLGAIENKVSKQGYICSPERSESGTHISSLPLELMMYILRWVVSSDLDMISLERFSSVCCGFYLYARDPEIWKLACIRTWGINCGNYKTQGFQSWRHMFVERPKLRFNGCYISKTSYVRPGENSFQDQFYRPWHFVTYFRYLRFFPDGIVLMMTTPDEPVSCLDRLKNRNAKTQGILSGHYRLSGDKVAISVKAGVNQNKQIQSTNTRFKSRRKETLEQTENTFHLELQLKSHFPNMFCSLVWRAYTIYALNKTNLNQTTTSFEIVKSKFPSFKFSQVNRFHAKTESPLQ